VDEVTIRELRNQGGAVIDRLAPDEIVTVTRDGEPVAELRRLSRRPLTTEQLIERFKHVPRIDYDQLRADIDAIIDPSL
jgi:antitoxin (DNA-binding transcriptional repressor) of toxin-antitoxin stability system